jgi:hypothetical protein
MLVEVLILLLSTLLVFHIYRATNYTVREGAGTYADYENGGDDSSACMTLASQNEDNITWLKSQIDSIAAVGTQLSGMQGSVDNNASTLKTLVDQQTTVAGMPDTDDDTDDDTAS